MINPDSHFQGGVIIGCKKQALEKATKYRAGLVMWTDGSKLDQGNTGAAVCWRDKKLDRWKDKSVFLGKKNKILDAELWAISEDTPITIFWDSQKALKESSIPLLTHKIGF